MYYVELRYRGRLRMFAAGPLRLPGRLPDLGRLLDLPAVGTRGPALLLGRISEKSVP